LNHVLCDERRIFEHGIFHGTGTYTSKNSIENTGLFMLVYNRVGVTGAGWQQQALTAYKVFAVN
jgi:hypothetical protein